MSEDDLAEWTGNRNRDIWKSTCARAALSVRFLPFLSLIIFMPQYILKSSLPTYERVLYAALAPSPKTSVILKSACRTWEDHLWAQISIVCEEKQTMELARLGGSFWVGGPTDVEKGVRIVSEETLDLEEDEWQQEVLGALEGVGTVKVDEG